MSESRKNLSRRAFVGGAGLAAAGMIGVLSGCSPSQPTNTSSNGQADDEVIIDAPASFDEELTCDIVVVGAGGSGLAACIEAAEQGKKIICVESQHQTGGNLAIVEGVFAVDSRLQQEQGIVINTGEVIRKELEQGQYRVSSLGYTDLIGRSGDNVNWLQDHGVTFQSVDPDHGTLPLFHRFEGSSGAVGYIPAMTAAAESAGVEFLYKTHGDSVIQTEDGSIQGIYATQDESVILKINAKAVIIATGSFRDNDKYLREIGLDPDKNINMGLPGHDGAGHAMAIACGAQSNMSNSASIGDVSIVGLPTYFDGGKFNPTFCVHHPEALWLNENGERFLNEDFALQNMMISPVATMWHKGTFVFVDEALMQRYIQNADALLAQTNAGGWDTGEGAELELQKGIEIGQIFKAETLNELAAVAGFDAELLAATIERYNSNVAAGLDRDFGKDPSYLAGIGGGPYYVAIATPASNVLVGSVKTDRNFNAIDSSGDPIEGLYVIGVEGAMLWSNVYTVNIAGGCNANNVNSGRKAAQHAIVTVL